MAENKYISHIDNGSENYEIHAAQFYNNISKGSSKKPIFIAGGVPTEIDYTIEKSVPEDAVFTDTTYDFETGGVNGSISVKPSSSDVKIDIPVAGLQSAAFKEASAFESAGALNAAKEYADEKVLTLKQELLDGASEPTLDSIRELAEAIKTNDTAIDALNEIAGTKASIQDLEEHINHQNNPHNVTAEHLGLGSVLTDIQVLQGVDSETAAELLNLQQEIIDVNGRVDAHVEQAKAELTEAIAVESVARQNLSDIVNSNLEKITALETSNENIGLKVDNNTEEIEKLKESNIGAGSGLTDEDRALLDYIRTFFNLSNPDKNQIIIGDAILTCVELDDETKKLEITFS